VLRHEGMRTQALTPLTVFLFLTSLVACSSSVTSGGTDRGSGGAGGSGQEPPHVLLSSYDRSCSLDSDCVLAANDQACAICGCPDGAINKKDEPKYEADMTAARQLCPPLDEGVLCGACQERKAVCDAGTCAAVDVR
jgi:hypothetical protein